MQAVQNKPLVSQIAQPINYAKALDRLTKVSVFKRVERQLSPKFYIPYDSTETITNNGKGKTVDPNAATTVNAAIANKVTVVTSYVDILMDVHRKVQRLEIGKLDKELNRIIITPDTGLLVSGDKTGNLVAFITHGAGCYGLSIEETSGVATDLMGILEADSQKTIIHRLKLQFGHFYNFQR